MKNSQENSLLGGTVFTTNGTIRLLERRRINMNRTEQDQRAAEIGMMRPDNPAQQEIDLRRGFDQAAYTNKLMQLPIAPLIFPEVDS